MKKLFSILILSIMSMAQLFAASGDSIPAETVTPATTVEEKTVKYTYYWGNGCPHCSKVNAYMKWVDAESKIDIDKKEIWRDRENAALFTKDAERLGLDTAKLWVPFMIVNTDGVETTLNGSAEIIEHFKPILGEPVPNKARPIVLSILGLIVILVPLYLIFWGKKKA